MERVNELLLREIARFVLENQEPETGLLTFTAVETTDDLMEAKVFYSVLGTDAEKARAAESLDRMRSDITRAMRRLESLKRFPHLHFVYDETPSHAARVHALIEKAHHESSGTTHPPAVG
jgi:ribosome-binding factor A